MNYNRLKNKMVTCIYNGVNEKYLSYETTYIYIADFAAVCSGSAFSQSMTISGGNDHGIVICSQGYVYAWGLNKSTTGDNLLGLDQTAPGYQYQTYYTTPQPVKMGGLTFSKVTAGSGATIMVWFVTVWFMRGVKMTNMNVDKVRIPQS